MTVLTAMSGVPAFPRGNSDETEFAVFPRALYISSAWFSDVNFTAINSLFLSPSPPFLPYLSLSLYRPLSLSVSVACSVSSVCFSAQAKVRELEERCRAQSEQFNMLSKELERFRVQAGKLDLLGSGHLTGGDSPDSPSKTPSLCSLLNGLGKGV